MDGARGKGATQSGQQQACILSGGVYLCHRLEKHHMPFLPHAYYHKEQRRAISAFRRAGVQEAVRF